MKERARSFVDFFELLSQALGHPETEPDVDKVVEAAMNLRGSTPEMASCAEQLCRDLRENLEFENRIKEGMLTPQERHALGLLNTSQNPFHN